MYFLHFILLCFVYHGNVFLYVCENKVIKETLQIMNKRELKKNFKLLYCCSITVVCILSPPLYPTPAKPTSLPCFHPPLWFCPCVLYSSSWKPLSPLSLPPSPLAIVRLFLTSVSLVIFCLLFSSVDYVPVKGNSNTWWLYSIINFSLKSIEWAVFIKSTILSCRKKIYASIVCSEIPSQDIVFLPIFIASWTFHI